MSYAQRPRSTRTSLTQSLEPHRDVGFLQPLDLLSFVAKEIDTVFADELHCASALLAKGIPPREELREASDHCEAALQLDPDIALAYFHLGVVAREVSTREQSDDLLRKAVSLDPGLGPAREAFLASHATPRTEPTDG